MENEVFKKLKVLIEALTHSGCSSLNEDIFKEVKKLCKSSQENIPHVYKLVLKELKRNNSQIRLTAFQICKELFKRSCLFREYVLKDLNQIFNLTLEINSKKLPPPKSSAESLKQLVISTLRTWVDEYSETYKVLKVAYKYFEKCKQVDFETFQVRSSAEQALENEQQRHIRIVNEEKVKKVLEEFSSNEPEIKSIVTSLSNCLSLLLPPVEEFFIPEHDLEKVHNKIDNSSCNNGSDNSTENCSESEDEDSEICLPNRSNLQECGISLDYNLSLKLDLGDKFKVVKTEENSSVIENAKDCVRLINNRFLPMVKKWIRILCKCLEGNNDNIKKVIDLKEGIENILKKYNLLLIDEIIPADKNETDSDDDDEFEVVKKEGYEDSVDFSEETMLDCLKNKSDSRNSVQNVATTSASTSTSTKSHTDKSEVCSSTSCTSSCEQSSSGASKSSSQISDRKKKLLSVAPKLPYDIDLYHWEDEKLSTPTLVSTKIDVDKFWGCAGSDEIHEIPNPDGVAALRTRVIEFSGTFEPVKWACRAPLPNGKLCPRKDRFKCPFHGKIVPRDETGNVQKKDCETSNIVTEQPAEISNLQDSEFISDLEAATGLNLKMPEKKGKKRKSEKKNLTHKKMKTSAGALRILQSKNLPGLVDVVKKQNNAYTRLSKKIFNRSSLRRVSAVLNKLDRNKFRDKFGDQFNYS